jgi:hypothetical protein
MKSTSFRLLIIALAVAIKALPFLLEFSVAETILCFVVASISIASAIFFPVLDPQSIRK